MTKHTTGAQSLIIDVGTAFLSSGLLGKSKTGTPRLESLERAPIGSGSDTSRDALLVLVEEALKGILTKYQSKKINHVHIVLAAPWYEAHIKTINSHAEKPVSISERTINKAVEQYKQEAPPKSGNVDVEAVAVQVRVNGYGTEVREPVQGQDLRINFYESETSETVHKKITDRIHAVFPHTVISFHTFPLVSLVALRSLTSESSFIVVDVAGEMTEVGLVHEDCLVHLGSFPIGYYTIARESGENKENIADALSRLEVYGRGELSHEETSSTAERFTKAFTPWKEAFQKTMHEASGVAPIPQRLFLITDREHTLWIRRGIEAENTFSFGIETVAAPYVQNHLELGEGASYDIFLSLSALFFHTYRSALIGEAS